MKKLIKLFLITLLISGCTKSLITYPIYTPCKKIAPPIMPPLPIQKLNAKSTDSEVIQAFVQTTQIQQAQLEYFYRS